MQILECLIVFSLPFPVNAHGKTEEGGPNIWIPATHVGNQGGIPGPIFTITAIWKENQQMEDLFL